MICRAEYIDMTTSPHEDILITDGYSIEKFTNNKVADLEAIDTPVNSDDLRFIEWDGNILKITCYEFLLWGKELDLYLDCVSMEWIDRL